MYELKQGTDRLVHALYSNRENQARVERIAKDLSYIPEQLSQDMQALYDFHSLYDLWSNNAAAGYAMAAAQAIGLDHKQTGKLIDAMTAAFENMTVEEAKDLYEEGDL